MIFIPTIDGWHVVIKLGLDVHGYEPLCDHTPDIYPTTDHLVFVHKIEDVGCFECQRILKEQA